MIRQKKYATRVRRLESGSRVGIRYKLETDVSKVIQRYR